MWHGHSIVSDHRQLDCLFNRLFRPITKESSNIRIASPLRGEYTLGSPQQRHCDTESVFMSLQWRHNGRDSVSNHQPRECLLSRLIRRRSKKASKLRVTGLCVGNSPESGEFTAQRASNAENVSIWLRHHVMTSSCANADKMAVVVPQVQHTSGLTVRTLATF